MTYRVILINDNSVDCLCAANIIVYMYNIEKVNVSVDYLLKHIE